MRLTRAGLLFGAALVGGTLLAAIMLLLILLGDCWAAFETPEAIRQCEVDKRFEGMAFLGTSSVLLLSAIVMRFRCQPYAKELAVLAGPAAFVLWLVMY